MLDPPFHPDVSVLPRAAGWPVLSGPPAPLPPELQPPSQVTALPGTSAAPPTTPQGPFLCPGWHPCFFSPECASPRWVSLHPGLALRALEWPW